MQTNVIEYLERGVLRNSKIKTALIDDGLSMTFDALQHDARICAKTIKDRINRYKEPITALLHKCAHTLVANLGILFSEIFIGTWMSDQLNNI